MKVGGGDGPGGPLPRIEEASLHSVDNVSAQYLVSQVLDCKQKGVHHLCIEQQDIRIHTYYVHDLMFASTRLHVVVC